MVLGAGMLSATGRLGGVMHLAMHAFGKITLFFCAGAILVATQKTHISEMRGLGRRMPFTMAAFLIASLSIIGLPPGGGTWSKWYLVLGTLEAGQLALMAALLTGSLLSALYLLPLPVRAFFSEPVPASTAGRKTEAPLACRLAIGLTAGGCVLLFVYADTLYAVARLLAAGGPHG
jgi:multicomponent Na+:H+ antiporter subunit D